MRFRSIPFILSFTAFSATGVLASGGSMRSEIVADYGKKVSKERIAVNETTLSAVDNGYPCSTMYLNIPAPDGAVTTLHSLWTLYNPNACDDFRNLLNIAEKSDGEIAFTQVAHLQRIRYTEDGDSEEHLVCRLYLSYPLAGQKPLLFNGSDLKFCAGLLR